MAQVIKADQILMNVYHLCPDLEKITFKELGQLSCLIVKESKGSVLTEVHRISIENAARFRSRCMNVPNNQACVEFKETKIRGQEHYLNLINGEVGGQRDRVTGYIRNAVLSRKYLEK